MTGVRTVCRAVTVAGLVATALTLTALTPLDAPARAQSPGHAAARAAAHTSTETTETTETTRDSGTRAGTTNGTASKEAHGTTATRARSAAAARPAAPALRADGGSYRYWSFWEQSGEPGEWSYATQGPSVLRPGDGDVLGFRFALSEDSKDAAKPRGRTGFSGVCDGTTPKPGRKRVALSIDFGTSAHAPRGESPPGPREACARVADDATAADALAAVAKPLRYDSAALLCAIDGYPQRGCGERIAGGGDGKDEAADGTEKPGSRPEEGGTSGSLAGTAAAAVAVAVLTVAAVRRSRRNRPGPHP